MSDQSQHNESMQWLRSFATLNWYEETIKFIFNFVTKTSELLLAVGIVISTANFLTDGDIMSHNKALSDAWSWAQALAIDSSLGIVFMNAFQALREREKIKAVIFFTLTALLASVAGLITHFDALGHAAGLPVTSVSRIIPLWIMTALRSVAVIGFLLASRLKNVSFNELRRELAHEPQQESEQSQKPQSEPAVLQIDYDALATALIGAMRQAGTIGRISITEEEKLDTPPEPEEKENHHQRLTLTLLHGTEELREPADNWNRLIAGTATDKQQEQEPFNGNQSVERWEPSRTSTGTNERQEPKLTKGNRAMGTADQRELKSTTEPVPIARTSGEKLRKAYQIMQVEKCKITGEALSKRAGVRKQTALEWLQKQHEHRAELEEQA